VSRRLLLAPVLIVLASLTFAACGTSPEDKAYSDGKDLGSAVQNLYQASDVSQAQAALGDVKSAISSIHSETRDHIQQQAQVQGATIENAVGNLQSGSLDAVKNDIQDLRAQASSFEDQNDSIANAFWRGYADGYDD
jgi:N-methylhydantoinase B/oxoprolinase/acetone carboxylase alpha subunit